MQGRLGRDTGTIRGIGSQRCSSDRTPSVGLVRSVFSGWVRVRVGCPSWSCLAKVFIFMVVLVLMALHYITFHCIALHCIARHRTRLVESRARCGQSYYHVVL